MPSVGIDGATGKVLVGWDHIAHRMGRLLSTDLGTRPERRDYGALNPRLLDKPQNEETLVNFYMATAEALEPRLVRNRWYGEPCFDLNQCRIAADTPGSVAVALIGFEIPDGHLGNFARAAPRVVTYSANRLTDTVFFALVR